MSEQTQGRRETLVQTLREEIRTGQVRTAEDAYGRSLGLLFDAEIRAPDPDFVSILSALTAVADGAFSEENETWEQIEARAMDGDVSVEEWREIEARIMDGEVQV